MKKILPLQKRPRKITLRDLTEEQFMAILKKVCQPVNKQQNLKQVKNTKENEGAKSEGMV
jgi:hypothetical protein